MKDHHHKVAQNDQDTLLTLLRNCASAPPAGVYDSLSCDHHYQRAVEKLKDSLLWKENEKLREWLNTTWLPTSRVSHVESKSCIVGTSVQCVRWE